MASWCWLRCFWTCTPAGGSGGEALLSMYAHAILAGADLRAELRGTEATLRVRLEQLDLDQISRVWDGLEGSFQLSVSYEVSLVDINTAREPDSRAPVLSVLAE